MSLVFESLNVNRDLYKPPFAFAKMAYYSNKAKRKIEKYCNMGKKRTVESLQLSTKSPIFVTKNITP